jgi:hypothetical protein
MLRCAYSPVNMECSRSCRGRNRDIVEVMAVGSVGMIPLPATSARLIAVGEAQAWRRRADLRSRLSSPFADPAFGADE